MIRLYTQTFNPFSEKVAAALELKALPFERVVSDAPDDVRRWSPVVRTLPVLEIDGRRMAESNRIVAWLDELHPEPPLFSRDPRTAEHQRRLASWSDDSFAWYWNRWRALQQTSSEGAGGPPPNSRIARLRERLRRPVGSAPRGSLGAREAVIIEEIEARLDDLVGFLGARPFFHAEEPSIADLAVFAMLRVLQMGPIPRTADAIAARPSLVAFLERLAQRIESARKPPPGPAR
jgi:glutathione S-transferase